jgi:FtsH-binding integral membrane protein
MASFDERPSARDYAPGRWSPYADAIDRTESRSTFLNGVYQHMALGLGVTGVVAMMAARSPEAISLVIQHPFILIFAQLGVVLALNGLSDRMSTLVTGSLFYLYSALTGLMFSLLFVIYTGESIATTFFVTGGTFGAMSLYGYVTKRDLTGVGNFLIMGLIGIILASLVNIWLQSSMVVWITTWLGVLIFTGLSAYDTQKIRRIADAIGPGERASKLAIRAALMLYLDFINLFLMLLRLFGRRR